MVGRQRRVPTSIRAIAERSEFFRSSVMICTAIVTYLYGSHAGFVTLKVVESGKKPAVSVRGGALVLDGRRGDQSVLAIELASSGVSIGNRGGSPLYCVTWRSQAMDLAHLAYRAGLRGYNDPVRARQQAHHFGQRHFPAIHGAFVPAFARTLGAPRADPEGRLGGDLNSGRGRGAPANGFGSHRLDGARSGAGQPDGSCSGSHLGFDHHRPPLDGKALR